jgi:predicted nucleic acid-binding protein
MIEQAVEVWIPFMAAEIRPVRPAAALPRTSACSEFLLLPGVALLYADRETTDVYARLFIQLRRAGRPFPSLIASLAVSATPVAIRDEHFNILPQTPAPDP